MQFRNEHPLRRNGFWTGKKLARISHTLCVEWPATVSGENEGLETLRGRSFFVGEGVGEQQGQRLGRASPLTAAVMKGM